MIMSTAFDFALLFISTCSAFYCWTLSRRLHALQNLRKGVGQAMVNLTKSVSSVEANAAKLNREALAAVSELRIMLSKVDASEEKVDILLETMERQARETWKEYKAKTGEATERLDAAYKSLTDGLTEARDLTKLIEEKSKEIKAPAAPPAPQPALRPQPEVQSQPQLKARDYEAAADIAPVRETEAPRQRPAVRRPQISGDREMTAREVALARALAAQRAKEAAVRKAAQQDDLANYTPEAPAMPPRDDAVASFARRLRQKQGQASLKQAPLDRGRQAKA